MTLGSRLVLGLGLVVILVMGIYGATSLRHRRELVHSTIERETVALARALDAVARDARRPGTSVALDPIMARVREDPGFPVVALVDSGARVTAGGPARLPRCIAALLEPTPSTALRRWTRCDGGSQLVVIIPDRVGGALVIARGTDVADRDLAAARRRIILTSVALAVLASLAILFVLHLALTRPLAAVMAGVRATGGPAPPSTVPVPTRREAGELRELALAFNEMVERLEGKRLSLAREVEERIELDRRLRRSESFAALGRLTGGVAHELGSPLGVIGVRAEAIHSDPTASEASRRHAAEISKEVDRIARLVRDLIHVSRRHGPGTDPVDLTVLVRDLVEEMAPQTEVAGIRVDLDLPDNGAAVPVEGDATLLRHSIYNVMLNAVQALRDHPGERRINVRVRRAGEVARISINDTGPGIAADDYPHLFEPFFTTRDVGEGSGLGLSISAGIAEEHGGTLTLVPARGGGVSAYFDLPVHDPLAKSTE